MIDFLESVDRFSTVLLFGPPGAGKGTQGRILGAIPGFYHCACGDVFRRINVNSKIGQTFLEYSSRGELVPDDVTVDLWAQNIHAQVVLNAFKPNEDLLILDGIPRNPHQSEMMDKYLNVLHVIHLVCRDEEAMIHRLRRRAIKENRVDDAKEEVIRNRWHVYEEETAPVLEYYDDEIISDIDAMRSPAAVLDQILRVLIPIQATHYEMA